ncbi:IS110 family transposase [Salmonella enterica]|uniref:IS110 family transposase n=5 Tax=Salmonella enterica TaxID=28901 RepID=A0A3U4YH23_SALET|nr:IS110 family transposase [Salmonella enterica]EAA3462726.1 IS110 family transposase [Salmonella enterica subsp. enterica serovar Miami]EAA4490798.1 IS110 family transposase [Salmonella enterica subsp. enterica]EAA6278017.1 IS110 family transposase [Salmonella enterica subsp. enterica serovar Telhashomer]EBM1014995.1 IS110 family transposase [Salmonella enterica subsp. enterica serovar Paratyphi B]EBQ5852201.1 IS110 family transposase [Salmonella enterica subsp. enterica serovar Virchow]ECK
MKYTPVGVDIAKHLIQVHLINEHTGEVVDKQVSRQGFMTFFSNREPCLIGMEACGGSQYWARELTKLGHKVRLMQGRFVKAFVMGNKNDMMDARAIWMAVQQPGRKIAVKTEEQQSVLVLHRSRRQLVKFRTAQINALHGTLLEFGETIHKGRAAMDRELPAALERLKTKLPPYLTNVLEDQYSRLIELGTLIDGLEKQLISVARQNETCKRLMEIPGVGPLIATAAVATMGEASAFKSGREFAAYVGLVPKQTGSGGKVRLLGISKRGDTYLRTLFIHGARAASLCAKEPGPWITELKKRRPTGVAIVAIANKLARTLWAIAAHGREYDKNHVSIRPY